MKCLTNVFGVFAELVLVFMVLVLANYITHAAPLAKRRRFRIQVRHLPAAAWGAQSIGFGLKFGYWPCLKAPYIQIAFLFWRVEIWHGLPAESKAETTDRFHRHLLEVATAIPFTNARIQAGLALRDGGIDAWAESMVASAQETFQ